MAISQVDISTLRRLTIPAEMAFQSYTVGGVPIDILTDLAMEHGATVDIEGFYKLYEDHCKLAKGSWKGSGDSLVPSELVSWADKGVIPEFVGHEKLIQKTKLLAAWYPTIDTSSPTTSPITAWISPEKCPFYPESGGQTGDIGYVKFSYKNGKETVKSFFPVLDTIAPYPGGIACKVCLLVLFRC